MSNFVSAVEDITLVSAARFVNGMEWNADKDIKTIARVYKRAEDEVRLMYDVLFGPAVVSLVAEK